ncbi:conserved hypothetical protein [Vibrio coralliirubri]|uniref:hypothetical protein n=1 Tax=Vibrio coralliirubri TaxID=1516159 RepID=UPI0006388CEE|nr:hypothetical protein [Vibrio coralliirubri]CDT62423.1 conserved hypothetical protein [Vibrio coralliirubri]
MENHIPLNRQFSLVPRNQEEAERTEFSFSWGGSKPNSWVDLDNEFRCIILAEAGAGKTEEFRQHAMELQSQGKSAFFIRLENIDRYFYEAFDVGEENQFHLWLDSTNEAWFFLDSVDESRLSNPKTFEKAIRQFAKVIKRAAHRAHIYISSRPYSWRPIEDRKLMDNWLFLPSASEGIKTQEGNVAKKKSSLKIYTLRHLDEDRIHQFCTTRLTKDLGRLINEIARTNLWSLAERPFDLDGILAKWADENELGGRLDLLRHNITKRLSDEHNIDRILLQPMNAEKLRSGAQRLAAAVVLTGQAGISVPDATFVKTGINAETVLYDWTPNEVSALLERGIFNDVIYGAVRFRHREVRELLAAEWFEKLLKSGHNRSSIENLFFREQYGQKILTPLLRPILPWLILFDSEIKLKALNVTPEIAFEGGDPSRLPFRERANTLTTIVHRISLNKDCYSIQNNNVITRIANPDLSDHTLTLIEKYIDNDEVVFFLGRLVWQGEMSSCVSSLVPVAEDHLRDLYARIASTRAIATIGRPDQKQNLWLKLNENDAKIPRELLIELIEEADVNSDNVVQLLISLGKLEVYEQFETHSLSRALHSFVDRMCLGLIPQLVEGLNCYLERAPFIERQECRVSEKYAWLLGIAMHAIETLIKVRHEMALGIISQSILLKVPAVRFWRGDDFTEYKSELMKLVPNWVELNDALYWNCIQKCRDGNISNPDKKVTDDRDVSWLCHFWSFDATSLPRLLNFIRTNPLEDNKLVALSTAFRVYLQSDRTEDIITLLRDVVSNEPVLQDKLDTLISPPVSQEMQIYEEKRANRQRKFVEKKERKKLERERWIADLRANPEKIYSSPNLKYGDFSWDQYWLMLEIQDINETTSRWGFSRWSALIPEFGEAVALGYRQAAVKHWKEYQPTLHSERTEENSTSYSLIFAMAGLEIMAEESLEFPKNLSNADACHALRYVFWELNGFPTWLERMHKAFPNLVEAAVTKELIWELESAGSNKILHDLTYHAPWIHPYISSVILNWININPNLSSSARGCCLQILLNGETPPITLAELALTQILKSSKPDDISWWFALRVDCEPDKGLIEVEQWLSELDSGIAEHSAQIFITSLLGGRSSRQITPNIGKYNTSNHLKSLYTLIHKYVKVGEDIDRSNGEVFSPELRDDAQDARNRIFTLLSDIPGKGSYLAINQLIQEYPSSRSWMEKEAYKRAEIDGDLKTWSEQQISEFSKSKSIEPSTHRQLFDLAVEQLNELKNWLERGNDSPWRTWQRAEKETEMRTLIAGWLRQQSNNKYTVAEENELANSQRMDIILDNPNVHSPVPIELKLLDKKWSGNKLCERLRNQLAGDYIREESAKCGVFLLVSQKMNQKWIINDNQVGLNDLADSLKSYWLEISHNYVGIEEIAIIVIDLVKRAEVSDT